MFLCGRPWVFHVVAALCELPAAVPLFLGCRLCTPGDSSGLCFCAVALHVHRELMKSKVGQMPSSVCCGSFCRHQSWLSEAPDEQRVRRGSFSQGSLKLLCHRSFAELQIAFSLPLFSKSAAVPEVAGDFYSCVLVHE